ncbi:class I SAM-dependent methyltransferase [soil metagenome]
MNDLPPEFFARRDEHADELFYRRARRASHIDARACTVARDLYEELLPTGAILDLMAGSDSHLGPRFLRQRVVGLGLDGEGLAANPHLDERVVHDLNVGDPLPFEAGSFGAAICSVAVQYLTRPCVTFAEVGRVLGPGAPFVVTFSVRMFPTKAVLAWRASDDAAHLRLVEHYFAASGAFTELERRLHVPADGDPLYAVWSRTPVGPQRAEP